MMKLRPLFNPILQIISLPIFSEVAIDCDAPRYLAQYRMTRHLCIYPTKQKCIIHKIREFHPKVLIFSYLEICFQLAIWIVLEFLCIQELMARLTDNSR